MGACTSSAVSAAVADAKPVQEIAEKDFHGTLQNLPNPAQKRNCGKPKMPTVEIPSSQVISILDFEGADVARWTGRGEKVFHSFTGTPIYLRKDVDPWQPLLPTKRTTQEHMKKLNTFLGEVDKNPDTFKELIEGGRLEMDLVNGPAGKGCQILASNAADGSLLLWV
mmetsp:Transcript_6609/g.14390  ORF Transcript_6609/g.14390 Transcript_6609/m.14390 type:complete len:167 (+) Transcript_6609:116-616(+)